MKTLLISLLMITGSLAFADSGYNQVDQLFQNGTEIKTTDLQTVAGIYTGRCFMENTDQIFGAFAILKFVGQDSGPIQVDSDLIGNFGTSSQSNFYDIVDVSAIFRQSPRYIFDHTADGIYQLNFPNEGLAQFRKSGSYIVQRNIAYNVARSACYYYQFRNL